MASPEEIALQEALKKGSSDLKFILTRNDVSNELQAGFYRNDVTSIQKFSSFFRSEDDLVRVLRAEFNTDADTSLQARAQVAAVICAWRETQTRQKRQAEVEAEMETREWTKPIPTGDYINMRNAYMKVYGRLEDKVTPSKEYLEKKLQELENGEFRAETMAEVVSKDEVDPDVMIPVFDARGAFQSEKGLLQFLCLQDLSSLDVGCRSWSMQSSCWPSSTPTGRRSRTSHVIFLNGTRTMFWVTMCGDFHQLICMGTKCRPHLGHWCFLTSKPYVRGRMH